MYARHSMTIKINKLLVLGFLLFSAVSINPQPVQAQAPNHFDFSDFTGGGAKIAGVPFVVTIIAKDASNNTLTSFSGSANLTDGTGTIIPTSTGNFLNGIWTGAVYITQASTSNTITVSYNATNNTSPNFAVNADNRIKFIDEVTKGHNVS